MAARRSVSLCRSLLLRPSVGTETSSPPGLHQSRYGILNQYSASQSSFTTELTGLSTQKRWASRAATTAAARTSVDDNKISIGPKKGKLDKDAKETEVLYEGPISSTIKKVKLLSLSTCCLSVSLGPVITFMTSPEMNVILKGGVASTVIFLSASTTAALHWFVNPYIHKLKWQPGSPTFDVEMMSWLATPLPRTIRFADVRAADTNRPFVTFKADDNFYFVDAEHCNNKALLARLTPEKPSGQGSPFKNI